MDLADPSIQETSLYGDTTKTRRRLRTLLNRLRRGEISSELLEAAIESALSYRQDSDDNFDAVLVIASMCGYLSFWPTEGATSG